MNSEWLPPWPKALLSSHFVNRKTCIVLVSKAARSISISKGMTEMKTQACMLGT